MYLKKYNLKGKYKTERIVTVITTVKLNDNIR